MIRTWDVTVGAAAPYLLRYQTCLTHIESEHDPLTDLEEKKTDVFNIYNLNKLK